MQTHTDHVAAMKAAAAAPQPYERDDDDEATGRALGNRDLEEEIPKEALESYYRWLIAFPAGDEDALAIYNAIPNAELHGIGLNDLADAMDGGDELALCKGIFGERFGGCVETLLRDDFCRRLEEYEYARDRLRERLDAGGATESDRAVIREDALRRVRDEELLGLRPFAGDESDAREISRRVVRARREHTCHDTGLPIAIGDRHLVLTESVDGDVIRTRHSVVAAWVDVVLEDDSLCDALRPEAAPLA